MSKTVADAISMAAEVKIVDLRFTGLLGTWQHFSIPARQLSEELFAEGIGFDGSSIRGFQAIHESDMLLKPDPETAFIDPMLEVPTLALICDIYDPVTGQPYSRDPRYIAKKAEAYLQQTGIANSSYWGPEAEFFLFSNVRYEASAYRASYAIDSPEGWWNSGQEQRPNFGGQIPPKQGYFPLPPVDTLQDVRSEIMLILEAAGVPVEIHHHEVASAGQAEIDLHYGPLTQTADRLMIYKYIVKNVARRHNLTATFMPKPLFGDNGSGMHVHQSLWQDGENIFYDESGYARLSQDALHYIGGLLQHAAAILAFAAPTTNSYRRLVPGFEAPVNLVYSQRNRSACVRIPAYSQRPQAKRIEFRPPDPSCNPYLCLAAMLLAGLDGAQAGIDPGAPMDVDLYALSPEEAAHIRSTPGSLAEVLDALEADAEFLGQGGVFTSDLIETWIAYKRENEVEPLQLRPHPYEFVLYYDV